MSYEAPYAGLKVVDFGQGIAAPYCGMLLAQYGADVVKVENTAGGDWVRSAGRSFGPHTALSVVGNLGKRSLALDLKAPEGKAVLWRLLEAADIVVEGFRPGVMERLGFGYAAVAARVPRILYVSVSGFGARGPMVRQPAMDPILQAFTGMSAENVGGDGVPHIVRTIVVDYGTALYAFQALAASLYARRDEPRGRHIETSLMQAAASFQADRIMLSHLVGGPPPLHPPNGIFRTADGWMQITIVRPYEWTGFCSAVERPDLAEDPRFATGEARVVNAAALQGIIGPLIAERPCAEWTARLTEAGLMHQRVNTFAEFLREAQVADMELVSWLHQTGMSGPVPMPNLVGPPPLVDGSPRAHAPAPGEHSTAILTEHGFTTAEIAALCERGVVVQG